MQVNSSLWIHRECTKLTRDSDWTLFLLHKTLKNQRMSPQNLILRLHYHFEAGALHSMRCDGSRYPSKFSIIWDHRAIIIFTSFALLLYNNPCGSMYFKLFSQFTSTVWAYRHASNTSQHRFLWKQKLVHWIWMLLNEFQTLFTIVICCMSIMHWWNKYTTVHYASCISTSIQCIMSNYYQFHIMLALKVRDKISTDGPMYGKFDCIARTKHL